MKKWISIILVIFISFTILYWADKILRFKYEDGVLPMRDLYAQKKGTVDVIFLGNSHMGRNVSAAMLYRNDGISSYGLWGSEQPLEITYYWLKEAITVQKPKVVVIDLLDILLTNMDESYSRQVKNTIGMRLSKNKIEMLKNTIPKENRLNFLLGFPTYHGRFDDIKKEDFENLFPNINHKNTYVDEAVYPYIEQRYPTTEVKQIDKKIEKQILQMIELAKETNTEILFTILPYVESSYENQKIWNYIEQLTEKHGAKFLNYFHHLDEIQFNYATDMLDSGAAHLNYSGVSKTSYLMGQFLRQNYQLKDHKNDKDYISWEVFAKKEEITHIQKTTDFTTYLKALNVPNIESYIVLNQATDDKIKTIQDMYHIKIKDKNDIVFIKDGKATMIDFKSQNLITMDNHFVTYQNKKKVKNQGIAIFVIDQSTNNFVDSKTF